MADSCTVIVGTYEKLILGYEVRLTDKKEANFHLVFTNNEHLAPIKCLAVSTGRGILASSGADESIRLLDLKKKVELGQLPYHKGTVNDLHFYKNSHLFSCSDDGKMVVWRRRDWNLVKAFRRHRGEAVRAVSVHPTGCLALSVGNDKTLRTWDLVAGKNAFSINLKKPAESVMWSCDGSFFAVVFDFWIDVYTTATGRICCHLPNSDVMFEKILSPNKKISTACFISNDVIVYGTESGCLCSVKVSDKDIKLNEVEKAHKTRVKAISLINRDSNNNNNKDGEEVLLLATVSSDGEIKIWKYENSNFHLLGSHETSFRVLSMAVWQHQPLVKARGEKSPKKRKISKNAASDEEEEEEEETGFFFDSKPEEEEKGSKPKNDKKLRAKLLKKKKLLKNSK